jgi:hypothetical protein
MCQYDRTVLSQRLRNQHTFIVRNWNTWPLSKKGAIVMERSHIHLRYNKRLACRS